MCNIFNSGNVKSNFKMYVSMYFLTFVYFDQLIRIIYVVIILFI